MVKAIIVGLDTGDDKEFASSIEEMYELAKACDYEIVESFVQTMEHPIPATYIGSGKVNEICEYVEANEIAVCIFEDTLSPVQHKNLQSVVNANILDRTALILEIFSKRARTREAKLQVEYANLQYMMPRLIGMWEAIGRQGGASGSKSNKGIGETQLELDRRWISKRMSELRRELEAISHDRTIQRQKRRKNSIPLVALVGYTNAGKSTIMNRLLQRSIHKLEEKQVFEEDMLFATLDTSVRRIETGDNKDFLLSDTVGFLNKLPHSLIKAFRSTLEEIQYADLLLEVVDISDEHHDEHMKVTMETLKEIGASNINCIHVMNKCDLCKSPITYPRVSGDRIFLSASNEDGLDELLELIRKEIYKGNVTRKYLVPYNQGRIVNELNERASVISTEYLPEGISIEADLPDFLANKLDKQLLEASTSE